MTRSVLIPLLAVVGLVLAGCSGPALSATAGEELGAHVEALRVAVAEEDTEAAHRKLAELRAALGDYEDDGEVDADRAASIREVIDEVEEMLSLIEDDAELAEGDTSEGDANADGDVGGGGADGDADRGGGADGDADRGGGPPDDRPGRGKGRDRGGGPDR